MLCWVYSKFSVSCHFTTRMNLKKSLKQLYPTKRSTMKKKKEVSACSLIWMMILLLTIRLSYLFFRKLSLKSKMKKRSLSSKRSIHSLLLKNYTRKSSICWRRQDLKRLTSMNMINCSVTFRIILNDLKMRQTRNLTPSLSN